MSITPRTYEEEYGGKVHCLVEFRDRGVLVQYLFLPEHEAVLVAAEAEHHGFEVVVLKSGEVIFGAGK